MLRRSACLAGAGMALLAAPASGAELMSTGLSTPTAVKRTCHAKLLAGGAGYVQRQVTAPATGVISARLNGQPGGDWDLGVFDGKGRTVAGSAHFGNVELAQGIAVKGQRLTVQACRRSGPVGTVQLRVAGWALPKATGDNRVQLVRVSTPTPAAKDRLAATGLDLTEHGSATYLDVVLHGADDVQTLTANGFSYRVVIPDLVRHDRAALRLSHSSPGPSLAMPSGRTNYRRLPDYSADLKRLAENNPGLVRPITLPYLTLEGRPVEGVEITSNPPARRQAGVPADGPPSRSRVALGRARHRVGPRARQRLWPGPADHQPRRPDADDRRPGRQPGRVQPHTRGSVRERGPRPDRGHGADRLRATGGRRRLRLQAAQLPHGAAQRRQQRLRAAPGRLLGDVEPHLRRRPEPKLRRLSGAGRGPAPTRPATPSGARGRSRSPRPGTCSGWSPTAK